MVAEEILKKYWKHDHFRVPQAEIIESVIEVNRIEKEMKKLGALKSKMKKEIGIKFSNGF